MGLKTAVAPAIALAAMLESVDYMRGKCRSTEFVGDVVDEATLRMARDSLEADRQREASAAELRG